MQKVLAAHRPLMEFAVNSEWARRGRHADAFDFTFGNPQEMPIPGFVDALQRWAVPQNKDWYAYKLSEADTRKTVADSLSSWRGMAFDAEDIHLTNGAFGAIATAFATFLEPGDEVIYSLPPWFGYEPMILQTGAVSVRIPVIADTFDLDLAAIEQSITQRTRMVIVNTPSNPTGKVYPQHTLERLGHILNEASSRFDQPIYLLADEPYARLVFEGKPFHSPTAYYAHSMISYSYGKVLLTPGERIGFLALPPTMPEREERRLEILTAQVAGGWLFPNALLQHAISDLDNLSLDLAELQYKRDMMVDGLRELGYQVHKPEATFYLLPRSPVTDDMAFVKVLAKHDVFVMPGTLCSIPGYFRITLSASRERLQQSLKAFERARRDVV